MLATSVSFFAIVASLNLRLLLILRCPSERSLYTHVTSQSRAHTQSSHQYVYFRKFKWVLVVMKAALLLITYADGGEHRNCTR
jgi:hypothetical protein